MPRSARWLIPLLAAALVLLCLLGLARVYEAWCADRIYLGVQVWGLPVGGMQLDEATARLDQLEE